MKINLKNISILGLITFVFVSAIACCCITKTVQAQEPAASCHQSEHKTDSSHNTEGCDCDQLSAIIKHDIALNNTFGAVAALVIDQQSESQSLNSTLVAAYQTSPQFFDKLPIYIKHSNLRI